MSKIEKELSKATGIESEAGEERSEYLARLLKATGKLADKDWEALSEEAQNWYNGNADARNKAKKAEAKIPDCTEFPDAVAEPPARARRRAADEDDDQPTAGSLKVGVRAKITTKKGKTYEGEVIELDDECVVIKDAGGTETEIDLEKIDTKEVFHGSAGKGAKDEEPADPLKKGAEVKLVTKRGKEVTGKIISIDDDEIVLKTDDGEEEFRRDRVESITPVGGAKASSRAAKEDDDQPTTRGRAKTEDKDEPAKNTRAKNEPGVSVGQVIKQLIVDNLDADEAAIMKLVKKAGVEAKENTVHLNYVECHKLLTLLREKKLLKG